MKDSKNLARYIQSLATVLQESAEIGQMNSAVYTDTVIRTHKLTHTANKRVGGII